MHELDITTACKDRFFLPPDVVVMEIKANDKVPVWLISLIGAYECNIKRVSKYCIGLERGMSMLGVSRFITG